MTAVASMAGTAASSVASMAGAVASSVASMAGAAAAKVKLGPDLLLKENSDIDEDLRLACIASGLHSLHKGAPNRVKIEGLPLTVEFDTFTYTKLNMEGKPKRFSIHINGPWCLTFEWLEENAYRVNLENYH